MECFVVYRNEIEGRFDPYFYKPTFKLLYKSLKGFKDIEVKKLGEISKRIKKGIFYILAEEYTSDGVPFIRVSNLKAGTITNENLVYITEDKNKKHRNTEFHPGDILISKTGNLAISIIPKSLPMCNISQDIIGIEIKEDYNPKYIAILLDSNIGRTQLKRILQGQVQPHLTIGSVHEILIPIISPGSQNKIIKIIDHARMIKKQKEAEARQLLDSINDYVFSELGIEVPRLKDQTTFVVYADDIKGRRIDPYYYQPRFAEIMKAVKNGKYELIKLKESLKVNEKLEDLKNYDEIQYVDLASIEKDLGIVKDYKMIKSSETPSRARQKVEKEDLLVASLSGSLKSIAIIDKDETNIIASTGFHVIKKSENYNNWYLWALFRTDVYQILLDREATGAIMSAINRISFLNLSIPLPPLELQNKIAEEVKRRMQKAEQLKKEAKEVLERAKQEVENIILNGENYKS